MEAIDRTKPLREEHIDVFRAFGILLMIMRHIGFGGPFGKFICAFHMPMFFIVSGMFFSMKDAPSVFLKKKVKSLLLPYAVFGLFHYVVWIIFKWPEVSIAPLSHLLFVNTSNLPIAGALWFLTALFFAIVIYYTVCRCVQGGVIQHVIVAIIAIFGCVATTIFPFRLPYALDAAFVGVGLMHIGCLYKKYSRNLRRLEELKIHETLILGIITTVLIFLNGYINMRTGRYAIIPLFWINVVLASVVGINIAKYFVRFAPVWMRNYMTSVGRNSIVYVCLNQLIIRCVGIVVMTFFDLSPMFSDYCELIMTLIVLWILEELIMKTKLRIVMGK